MADAATSTSGADLQTLRQRAVIGSLAWAYLAALGRGDAGRASALLSTFQSIWNARRDIVASKFPAATRDAILAARPLRVGGGFDSDTRSALLFSLAGQFNHAEWSTRLSAMPENTVALASYFNAQLKPIVPAANDLYTIDELAKETPTPEIPAAVGGEVEAVIMGLTLEEPRPTIQSSGRAAVRVSDIVETYRGGATTAPITKQPGAGASWWSKQPTPIKVALVATGAAVVGGTAAWFFWGRR